VTAVDDADKHYYLRHGDGRGVLSLLIVCLSVCLSVCLFVRDASLPKLLNGFGYNFAQYRRTMSMNNQLADLKPSCTNWMDITLLRSHSGLMLLQ